MDCSAEVCVLISGVSPRQLAGFRIPEFKDGVGRASERDMHDDVYNKMISAHGYLEQSRC
jgi:hypothetical protein